MANSRLERIGTIFTRVMGLLRSEAIKPENKPIWYDVYQSFPPKYQPRYDRAVPNVDITPIFYPEDVTRAQIKKLAPAVIGTVNLSDVTRLSNTQKAISYYQEAKETGSSEEAALQTAIDRVVAEGGIRRTETPTRGPRPPSIADEFRRSKNVVKDIFKA